MAQHILRMSLGMPSFSIVLDETAKKIWDEIVFFEEAREYRKYDEAWERFLNYLQEDIKDEVWSDLSVFSAKVTHG